TSPTPPIANDTVGSVAWPLASLLKLAARGEQPGWQLFCASSHVERALSPKNVPATKPSTPTAPAAMASVRCVEPPLVETSTAPPAPGGAAGPAPPAGSSARAGTSTETRAPFGATSIVFVHFCLPGDADSMTCLPGSTGMAVP